ncbi:hypothetical protein [Actinomycetospora termitidis]|uniref:Uncharacterized protein n=1 Tax=Actinomycetospora termitidis TaxID=3053470 RepID=A0ABT7MEF3_9PSEU|nr:hypothetical protein [Actinomycetospora sp. Odt1-22]MDL5159039.1 hypothetical protein [Actinomycetospora sp. Odt1-22]
MPPSTPDQPDDEAARRRFIDDLVARGEVAPRGADPMPPGTTHEVVEERDGVILSVRRRRFSTS